MVEDAELLRRYVDEESQEAFAELVQRHLGLVYFSALRRTNEAHLASDVAQTVFIRLAEHARALRRHPTLAAWLFSATRNAAFNACRTEARRQRREQEAFRMHDSSADQNEPIDIDRLRPWLDEALDRLPESDRCAVLLRYFERRAFNEIAGVLRVSEEAARKRVDRAIEKLQQSFTHRGITSTAAALTAALSAEAAAVAPSAVAGAVLSGAASVTPLAATSAFVATFLTMSKVTTGIAIAAIAVGLAATLGEVRANRALRAELGGLRVSMQEPTAINRDATRLNASLTQLAANDPRLAELTQLRQRAAVLAARPPEVDEAEFRKASTWRNVGRATIDAANETLHWAMFHQDLDAAAQFIAFRDDTPENRAAFLSQCSPAIQARYQTPERIVAAALFGLDGSGHQSPDDAIQVLGEDDHVGGDGLRFGQKHLRVWYHSADGKEFEGGSRWQQTSSGWVQGAMSLTSTAKPSDSALTLIPWLDSETGDRKPMKVDPKPRGKSP
jgi:RNA polymerase sigma factor (sigma-70 family)